jgi:hypothetical protein
MCSEPFLVDVRLNKTHFSTALIDHCCLSYATFSDDLVRRLKISTFDIEPRYLEGVVSKQGTIRKVAYAEIDIDSHQERRVFGYVVPGQRYPMILGKNWLAKQNVTVFAAEDKIKIGASGIEIPNRATNPLPKYKDCVGINATGFGIWMRQAKRADREYKRKLAKDPNARKPKTIEIMAITMADIDKALRPKPRTDPATKLPEYLKGELAAWDRSLADKLPKRRPDVDMKIELERNDDGTEKTVPWGPLYGMNREELLVLRKTLTELLDKNFIRVSNSPAAAPVLFARKPGGGVRFCVDYRGLNSITKKDRYPLPLISETLRNISKAKYLTKLDVIAAFNRVRIAEGDEWKTAFRTRYGLFEYLVMPFGLANAPSTFQRYINHTLREWLDDFVSAYIDDVLVYTDGSLEDHRQKVKMVVRRLREAGLHLDIDKCEFETQEVKYLGFIIEVGKGIRVDPEKIKAILQWEPPKNVKGVRGFIGFANFYRIFIPDFSDISAPLVSLTKKDVPFRWTDSHQNAFDELKRLFVTAPILAHFDSERETIVEADTSGWTIGGVLSQVDEDGQLRPNAYMSKKLSPAECNYDIHDKELLAIVKCLKEWRPELTSVKEFKILTDHKNLKYFYKSRQLSERQMRWAEFLSQFNFSLEYRPGKQNQRPDALSRRDQDIPKDSNDERVKAREAEMFPNVKINSTRVLDNEGELKIKKIASTLVFNDKELQDLWEKGIQADDTYALIFEAVERGDRKIPTQAERKGIKINIAELTISKRGLLSYRGRTWIPHYEQLRTRIMSMIHDSKLLAHPGENGVYTALQRQFFWPGASADVKRYCRNCHHCRGSTAWREGKHGLLKPLSIPHRSWKFISIDFITDLPPTGPEKATKMMVITDRLTKGVILERMANITAEACAEVLIRRFYSIHDIPDDIVSDRDRAFVSKLWARFCELLGIRRSMSTAYRPQSDGSTERMNQEIEKILRIFCNYSQTNWGQLLPVVEGAINKRTSSSTGFSPFFLLHGYHADPISTVTEDLDAPEETSEGAAEKIIKKLKESNEWAQAAMAVAQEKQEKYYNRHKKPAPKYRIGDEVWLDTRHWRTNRPCKKLDMKHRKYKITDIVNSHSYRLDVPGKKNDSFHVELLRPAASDPFPSQEQPKYEPGPMLFDGELKYIVEEVLCAKSVRENNKDVRKVLVKWVGYDEPTWEPLQNLEGNDLLIAYEDKWGSAKFYDGPRDRFEKTRRTRRRRDGPHQGHERGEKKGGM